MSYAILFTIALLLMLIGFVGIVLPALPGLPFMFLVALGFGLLDHFGHLTGKELVVLLVIALISLVVDHLSGVLGARLGGASAKATLAGFLGMIAGLLLLPPFGGFIGLFLGVLYVELRSGDLVKALQAASGSLLGSVAGILVNILLGIVFLISFILFALH